MASTNQKRVRTGQDGNEICKDMNEIGKGCKEAKTTAKLKSTR